MKKLRIFGLIAILSMLITSCAQPTPEKIIETVTVIETVEVVKEGETIIETVEVIKEVEVTATPEPVEKVEAPPVLGILPRSETFIAGILTGRVGSPSNFNEWVGWKWRDRGMQNLANEPLWSIDFATGEIIYGLASGDPIYNEDFTQVTFPLREGVAWSDGVPFTSADVVYTIELLKATEGLNAHSFMVENVASVSAPDEYTVVIDLLKPNSRFHTNFLDRWGCTWIMPKHIFETVEDPVTFEFNPFVGTGPYKLYSYDEGGYWTIWEKREDWDKSPTGILYGEPGPKYIVFQAFANEGAKILAQLTHELDAVDLSSEGLKAALTQGDTNRAYQAGYPWVVNNDPALTGLTFNTVRAPFDNPDVRWALLLAIDIAEYVGQAVDGTGTLSPVHIPSLGSYPANFIDPMQEWLSEFTLDLGNGQTFKPYDPDAEQRIVEYAAGRGYVVPEDPVAIEQAFGLGWYKYAPDEAALLLEKNGFTRNDEGMWLLPDGTPWRIEILTRSDSSHLEFKNGAAAAQQWKQFGIDAVHIPSDNVSALTGAGDFDVAGNWPAQEPWGAGPDLYRVLSFWNSAFIMPLGENTNGHTSRWSSPEMDAVIAELEATDPADVERTIELGIEGLKIVAAEMPGIPTFGYIGFVSWDTYYWGNWPGAENPYTQPYTHWGPFKYMTPFLEPTGK
ncbi:MAG: ABC transporter substrate-binding protein [Anaerolineales bacterium]|nr:ABC transporter substrate-binding protein [Anaerolineales bacterium]